MSEPLPFQGNLLLSQAKQALQTGDARRAEQIVSEAMASADLSDRREALYILAVSQRLQSHFTEALKAIADLKSLEPGYGRAYQEEGHVHRDSGKPDLALTAYAEAVRNNPALLASWRELAKIHANVGNQRNATLAREQVDRLTALPKELLAVASMLHEGKIGRAERICRAFLQKSPHHIEAMRLLADIGIRLHVLDDAEFLLESALELAPDHDLARLDYVGVLHKRQKFEKAMEQAEILRNRHPGHPIYENAWAGEAMAVGRYEDAIAAYDAILKDMPGSPQIELVRGHALKTIGKRQDAENAYRKAYSAKPDFGDAWWSLANLKTYRFSQDELDQMIIAEDSPNTSLIDRYHLCFALGKAHEDREDHDAAFAYYNRGNALKKSELRYDSDRISAEMQLQKQFCTRDLFAARKNHGHPDPAPIFVVGLPRSGSTLIEQILASHSQVEGTLELPNILAFAHKLNGRRQLNDEPRYPAVLHELDATVLENMGRTFINDTAVYRGASRFFVDKMPNNFRHIGLIKLILPNARIIDARRNPMDCCFSGFKQLFAEGQEFTYSLEDIGRYYRDYVDLMDHWDSVLPGEILRVQHEDVIEDLEGQVRRLLDHCGLPFEEDCLNFHETDRAVRTASSEQVRQPINRRGMDVWRKFDQHLIPLKIALGSNLAPDQS
ncbi:MAG: hypothetical protein CME88_17505 [Hirschia sp.]|nr:hypothetical protein [Hirschia sp.]MBF20170.1 hypothetical protein [Hirschia sp.]